MAWYDFSPMRPDEYKRQDAERWTEALQLHNVIRQERDRAKEEAAAMSKARQD